MIMNIENLRSLLDGADVSRVEIYDTDSDVWSADIYLSSGHLFQIGADGVLTFPGSGEAGYPTLQQELQDIYNSVDDNEFWWEVYKVTRLRDDLGREQLAMFAERAND